MGRVRCFMQVIEVIKYAETFLVWTRPTKLKSMHIQAGVLLHKAFKEQPRTEVPVKMYIYMSVVLTLILNVITIRLASGLAD